ncbi:MAG TPA: DUF177 domain-containing protein [Pyrinomonadaceae bacterium]|nr:DUF177 domain-containing protein [Pyrinomonadaceae bacterium]
MRIDIAGLEGGKGNFAHTYEPDELDLQDEWVRLLASPIVSGQARREGSRVKVTGKVAAKLRLECDRCLKPIEFPVDSRFELKYVTRADYQAQKADEPTLELTEEDLDLSVFDGEEIDVDELVREELLLAVPTHLICQENCKGVCPTCGADRNLTDCRCGEEYVDPRWAGLKELVNGKS